MVTKPERFSELSRQVLSNTEDEARNLNHINIDTAHILLAMLKIPACTSAYILASLGVDLAGLVKAIKSDAGKGHRPVEVSGLSLLSKNAITLAVKEASQSGTILINHLLIGIMLEGEGTAAHVLSEAGITVGEVREATRSLK
mgnify:CR=1 FL=1